MIRKFLKLPTMMQATYIAEGLIISSALIAVTVSVMLILLLTV